MKQRVPSHRSPGSRRLSHHKDTKARRSDLAIRSAFPWCLRAFAVKVFDLLPSRIPINPVPQLVQSPGGPKSGSRASILDFWTLDPIKRVPSHSSPVPFVPPRRPARRIGERRGEGQFLRAFLGETTCPVPSFPLAPCGRGVGREGPLGSRPVSPVPRVRANFFGLFPVKQRVPSRLLPDRSKTLAFGLSDPDKTCPDRIPTVPSRHVVGCRGSFLPLVKTDPHHRRGSLFVPGGNKDPHQKILDHSARVALAARPTTVRLRCVSHGATTHELRFFFPMQGAHDFS